LLAVGILLIRGLRLNWENYKKKLRLREIEALFIPTSSASLFRHLNLIGIFVFLRNTNDSYWLHSRDGKGEATTRRFYSSTGTSRKTTALKSTTTPCSTCSSAFPTSCSTPFRQWSAVTRSLRWPVQPWTGWSMSARRRTWRTWWFYRCTTLWNEARDVDVKDRGRLEFLFV